jgi:hypothetical protein
MFIKLCFLLLVAAGLSGCAQAQRFGLSKNAELDECAMKRMSETKISGQHGYLQAHHECNQIVNLQKGMALDITRKPEYGRRVLKDPLEEYSFCWEFVKGLYIDENYPDLRMPKRDRRIPTTDMEGQNQLKARNAKVKDLPNKLEDVSQEKLLEIRELMAVSSVIGHKTMCSPWRYHELESILGKTAHRLNSQAGTQ